jgi:peptidoglycan/LPS O-acetylase OafA/YrhL
MTAAPAAEGITSPTKPHLDSVDVVRVLSVALVIAVHVVSQQPGGIGLVNGAALIVMHVSRQVFFMVTTFVLVYTYRDHPPRHWSAFWRRRYLLVGVPYLVWSAVYFIADGHRLWPIGPALLGFAHDVAEGTARYHLYFLLVTMQVYLVFPLLLGLLRAARRRTWWLVAASLVYELAVYAVIEHKPPLGVLNGWVRNPNPFLPTYLGFVIIGGVAACHTDGLLAWTRARARWIYLGTGLAAAAGVAVLLVEVLVVGQPAWAVSSVFQPVVVIESLAIAWTYLAAGLAWQHRGARKGRLVRTAADASFGVYLAHPLLLQGLLLLSAYTGLSAVAEHAPPGLVTALSMTVVVPLIYLTCTVFAELVRRTPLSLPLTGRARRHVPEAKTRSPHEPDQTQSSAGTAPAGTTGSGEPARATRSNSTKRRGGRRGRRRRRQQRAKARSGHGGAA